MCLIAASSLLPHHCCRSSSSGHLFNHRVLLPNEELVVRDLPLLTHMSARHRQNESSAVDMHHQAHDARDHFEAAA
jgi:hypothetical protein